MTPGDLKKLANLRLSESKILLEEGYYDGSVYLAGYSLEIALKACICKTLKLSDYPDSGDTKGIFKSHDLSRLLLLAGLSRDISLASPNQILFRNWSVVTTKWGTDLRYKPVGTYTNQDATSMIDALEGRPDGMLTWIRRKRKW